MSAKFLKENLLEIKRFINAPRERVFAAWTRPDEMSQWLGGDHCACLSVMADVQIGGQWQIRMKSGSAGETEFFGVYLAVKPPAKLVYTWCWKNHPLMGTGETLVTVEFAELDGGTEIHLRHEGFTNVELRNRHTEGWSCCVEKLGTWLHEPAGVCQS